MARKVGVGRRQGALPCDGTPPGQERLYTRFMLPRNGSMEGHGRQDKKWRGGRA